MKVLSVDVTESLWDILPQLTSIILTTIIVCSICVAYDIKIRRLKSNHPIAGWLVLVNLIIRFVEDTIITSVGRKRLYLTPYILYIYAYIFTASLISILGFESLATSYTVTLSMAMVTFLMIYFYGIKIQKLVFFKKYINPVELITQFIPLISLSFRLFGNMVAGSVILLLIYSFTIGINGNVATGKGISGVIDEIWNTDGNNPYAEYKYFWSGFDLGSIIVFPFLHMYFDLFDGYLQSLVFANLTLAYWGEEVHETEDAEPLYNEYGKQKQTTKKIKNKSAAVAAN